jgi:glycosyltransferase involved in cell wall biosynthesis
MKKISAVIVAHNEEKKIGDCLRSLDFVDEIVVVLDKCTDKTKEIALSYAQKIIEGSWNIEGERRNIALANASGDWILEIDADERVSKELKEEILFTVNNNLSPCTFSVPIANYVGTRWVKYGWLRIFGVLERQTLSYRGLKIYDEDKEVHPTYKLDGEVKLLTKPIIHLVDDDISDLINRFNRYTNWKSNDMITKGEVTKEKILEKKFCDGFFSMMMAFKLRFFKSLILKKGYKEGLTGLLIAMLCGLYPLVSYLKAKEKIKNNLNENS